MIDSNDKYGLNMTNSEIIQHTLISLIIVASSKTSNDYAWAIIKKLLRELRINYSFLRFIKIDDISALNYSIEDISVSSDFEKVSLKEVGKAIQALIDLLKKYLDTKAGYFFIEAFKNVLGEKYYDTLKKMDVDLRLIELKKELYDLEINNYKLRESKDSNIAFVEKK
jgi:hypothetical protein